MQAVEFISKAHDGIVDLPREFQDWNGKPVRVILLEEPSGAKSSDQAAVANVWAKTSGAWQGEQLVREPQGEYEQRLELK
ncbi:MAG: hypothetical protein A3J49_08395 [Gallionellales bacterium RIFCSPHIGHO2_02_FULL_57_16]|nr:MAG: hypothetical protein A3J49_08395 [Gallionellales bacterium RIFCSPHIGHO2_02_FULL_57_16]